MTGRRMFYLTIVQSTLDYASTYYVDCLSAKLRDKLESTSNRCLRRVFGHDQYTSIGFILTKYNLYTFSRPVNLKLFVFVFRCLSRCTNPLLSTIFTPPPPPPLCTMPHKCCYPRSSFSRSEPTQSYISLRPECYFIFGSRQMEHASTWMSES